MMIKARIFPAFLLVVGVLLLLTAAACGSDSTPQVPATVGETSIPQESSDQENELPPSPTETQVPATPTRVPDIAEGPIAAEVADVAAWINSDPLTIQELRGNVVLVDFWTYTCVNCIRTFPFLRTWNAKYADLGLVILGVHTPEFEFEKDLANVSDAAEEHGIVWPIALDNDYGTWNAYNNRSWPAKYLIDKDGVVRYSHFGEGSYAETEEIIRDLLQEAGADLSGVDDTLPEDQVLDLGFLTNPSRPTRELYAGTGRGYSDVLYGQGGYVAPRLYYQNQDTIQTYEDRGSYRDDLLYLEGPWLNGSESLKHGRETQNFEDYMLVRVTSKSVNAVIKPGGDDSLSYKVLVTLDGEYLDDSNKGQDVVIEEDGRSFMVIDEPRLYAIIEAPSFGTFDLKLSSNSAHFNLFAFTFGVYDSGI